MVEMSKELIDLINNVPSCYLATATKDGVPNVDPFSSVRAVSADTIVIAANRLGKTVTNLKENPQAALVVHSEPPPRGEASLERLARVTGGQIKGSATLPTSGDIYEQTKRMTAEILGPEAAEAFDATIVLKVEEVFSITPGPKAGR